MARILIGNIKGPQGDTGQQGPQGEIGPVGPQGPLPPLINNALATEAGVAALDAVMGKTLQDQITQQDSNLAIVGDTTGMEFGTGAEKRYIVFKHEDGSRSSLELYNNGITLTRYNPSTDQWEGIWSLPIN